MAITTLAALQAARRQLISIVSISNPAAGLLGGQQRHHSRFNATGEPSGPLAGTSTIAGVVPTSADDGYPRIQSFGSGNKGYLLNAHAIRDGFGQHTLFDRLWVGGAYAFNANVTLTGQPSFASRLPNGDFSGLELWVETVTATSGTQTITVGYTNESGINNRSTSLTYFTANIGRNACFVFPLQSGDSGIQQINSVVGSGSIAGTYNIMILRRLVDLCVPLTNGCDSALSFDFDVLPEVYDTSALYLLVRSSPFGTPAAEGTGIPTFRCTIVEG